MILLLVIITVYGVVKVNTQISLSNLKENSFQDVKHFLNEVFKELMNTSVPPPIPVRLINIVEKVVKPVV